MAIKSFEIPVEGLLLNSPHITTPAPLDGAGTMYKVLFDANTDEEAVYKFDMPGDFVSGLTIELKYAMASATSGTVGLECKFAAIADGEDIDAADPYAAVKDITNGTTVPGTAGFRDTISFDMSSNDDGVAADETCLLHIVRDVDDDDTATGDLELVSIVVKYSDV